MKTVKRLADLHKTALARGAEVVGGGQHFNSGRARAVAPVTVQTPAPKAMLLDFNPPAPPPPAEPTLTRSEVQVLLNEHNIRVTEQFASIIAALKQSPQAPGAQPREWQFHVTYDAHHAITNVTAKAIP